MRLSYLVADFPEIAELDINPLLVSRSGITALDARIILDRDALGADIIPYSHLALRPYPEEYVRAFRLEEGTEIILRPIKPEDEPLWFNLLDRCSQETLYQRFRYLFHWKTHQVASRYCVIDYDREMAIVAEHNEGDKKQLLGVGRMVADPDRKTAEYAVLIQDDWQNKGLGGLLTDYCLKIAADWGIGRLTAQTTSDNPRMVAVFRSRDFTIRIDPRSSLIEVSRDIL
jgi:acetyltransferase